MNIPGLTIWLNETYPNRNWDQQCQRLVWNAIHYLAEVPEAEMVTYSTATAARHASHIESTDPDAAPVGAIHYWLRPAEGHVAVGLGGERVLMTGTQSALGAGGVMLGRNYGITTVSAYTRARGNPYLGWARTNGRNHTLIAAETAPEVQPEKKEDEMSKPIIAQKLDGGPMNTLGVMIEPDGTVTALNIGQWEFWRDRVGCVPVECKNPGHWEYLMETMAKRRARNNINVSEADLKKITDAVRASVNDASVNVTAKAVADALKITVK